MKVKAKTRFKFGDGGSFDIRTAYDAEQKPNGSIVVYDDNDCSLVFEGIFQLMEMFEIQ